MNANLKLKIGSMVQLVHIHKEKVLLLLLTLEHVPYWLILPGITVVIFVVNKA